MKPKTFCRSRVTEAQTNTWMERMLAQSEAAVDEYAEKRDREEQAQCFLVASGAVSMLSCSI